VRLLSHRAEARSRIEASKLRLLERVVSADGNLAFKNILM
jgi:hypothetical protein